MQLPRWTAEWQAGGRLRDALVGTGKERVVSTPAPALMPITLEDLEAEGGAGFDLKPVSSLLKTEPT